MVAPIEKDVISSYILHLNDAMVYFWLYFYLELTGTAMSPLFCPPLLNEGYCCVPLHCSLKIAVYLLYWCSILKKSRIEESTAK